MILTWRQHQSGSNSRSYWDGEAFLYPGHFTAAGCLLFLNIMCILWMLLSL